MPIDLQALTDEQLENLINNHRNKGATDLPVYVDALRAFEKRKGKGLDFDKSLRVIIEAAKEGRFVGYKELADANEAEWSKVHYAVGGHLRRMIEFAHRKGWPLVSAIVVNTKNVETGTMAPESQQGFISAARELGFAVVDADRFVSEEQQRVFAWAKDSQDSTDAAGQE